MIDFNNISQDFVLEDALRDDSDGENTRLLIQKFEAAKLDLSNSTLDADKCKLLESALSAAQETLPEIWQVLHPDKQW
jgi:hypothetical protein